MADELGIDNLSPTDRMEEEEGDISSAEEGEDLFGEDMEHDYVSDAEQDGYERTGIDDDQYEAMSREQRAQLDRQMDMQEAAQRRGMRLPAALEGSESEISIPVESDTPSRAERPGILEDMLNLEEDEEDDSEIFLEDFTGTLREWISTERCRRVICRQFYKMLKGEGASAEQTREDRVSYAEVVRDTCQKNKQSFEVSYKHISEIHPQLALWLNDEPAVILSYFDEVAMRFILTMFPEYMKIHSSVSVRIVDLPLLENLRKIRQVHLNKLIRVVGVVTKRTTVFPKLELVKFNCHACQALIGPITQGISSEEVKVLVCPECGATGNFTLNQSETIFRNFQKITLQEPPGKVPAGRIPRSREVTLVDDLIDSCKPGEEVEVIGIYVHSVNTAAAADMGFPIFQTMIEANNVVKRSTGMTHRLTTEEIREIRQLSKHENLFTMIKNSIGPSIYGSDFVKRAIAFSLFGGTPKNIKGKHNIRGDINVLMVGDPGTAKSQFLKFIEKAADRVVYTTGKGASAAGLTATVQKDPITREWTLEGGALVLADNGHCVIDEFDKMSDKDRTSLHEAMEQQSISISKAGIVTTLHARCAVIAAANPILGRYDASKAFSQNVELTDPILSRFDLLCVVRDIVDPEIDERLASFVVGSHMRSHPSFSTMPEGYKQEVDEIAGKFGEMGRGDGRVIPHELFQKYLLYARQEVSPLLTNVDKEKIVTFYGKLRKHSMSAGSVPTTIRHLESMFRIAESHAKMHLREYVRSDDIDVAIQIMTESFCASQKFSVRRNLEKTFDEYLNYKKSNVRLLENILMNMIRMKLQYIQFRHQIDLPNEVDIDKNDFEERARELEIHDVESFYHSSVFAEQRYSVDFEKGKITKSFVSVGSGR